METKKHIKPIRPVRYKLIDRPAHLCQWLGSETKPESASDLRGCDELAEGPMVRFECAGSQIDLRYCQRHATDALESGYAQVVYERPLTVN